MKKFVRVQAMLLLVFLTSAQYIFAQQNLQKQVSLDVKQQRIDQVLELLSNKGDFYFSYNSRLFKRDSLVSISVQQKSVKYILDQLFSEKLQYIESGRYIILRPRPVTLQLQTEQGVDEKFVQVKGWVLDDLTGERVGYASVYDRRFLASALTNDAGYFALRFRNRKGGAQLYVSKESYKDTSLYISLERDHKLTIPLVPVLPEGQIITVSPMDYLRPDTVIVKVEIDTNVLKYMPLLNVKKVEDNPIASFLLSARQKWQSMNLKNFFAERPFQLSLIPGLSTQGKMSGQVVNNFSFNVLGGYTGGVNGAEIAGLFNINKKRVQYVQVGGLFNFTGESVLGFQVGGVHNMVLDSATGFQLGGVWNHVGRAMSGMQVGGVGNFVGRDAKGFQVGGVINLTAGNMKGAQAAGVFNIAGKGIDGVQFSGVINVAGKGMKGVQAAGVMNISTKTIRGTQVAGVINYAKKVYGTQIGLINISDSSNAVNFGLLNIVFKGYHKLSIATNEVQPLNIAIKTGHPRFYNILTVGGDPKLNDRFFSFGYGLGSELRIAKWLSFNPSITSEYIYQGSWDYFNSLNKFHADVHFRITKWFSIFGGASASGYYTKQTIPGKGYRLLEYQHFNNKYTLSDNVNGWIGWNVGVHLF